MAKSFGTGTLTYAGNPVADVLDLKISVRKSVIPAPGAKTFPEAYASGPGEVSISCKLASVDSAFVADVLSADLAPLTEEIALGWSTTLHGGGTKGITFASVIIESWDLEMKSDGWAATNVSLKAMKPANSSTVGDVT